jgi:hypothetical protein
MTIYFGVGQEVLSLLPTHLQCLREARGALQTALELANPSHAEKLPPLLLELEGLIKLIEHMTHTRSLLTQASEVLALLEKLIVTISTLPPSQEEKLLPLACLPKLKEAAKYLASIQ